jgi:Glycosyl hydrolases family 2, sugar binding domain/Glycosyl hydrolases family 2
MNTSFNELAPTLSLGGEWKFELADQHGTVIVPGTWEAQGFPHRIEGPAFFQKTVVVPSDWQGKRIELQFDAVSYFAEVKVNDTLVGTHTGLWTPFAFDATSSIACGQENIITLTVYEPGERFPMRESLAGFLPDVCIPFGGMWQSARLTAFPGPSINDLWVLSSAASGDVRIQAKLHNATGMDATVRLLAPDSSEVAVWSDSVETEALDINLNIHQVETWSPNSPSRYTVEITITNGNDLLCRHRRPFGFRSLSTQKDQLCFNGDPIILRGILNWGWYPEILCPAPDEATIRDEFQRVRELGYNMVKLCLYVPSPLYFEIADAEGMFLWLELPMWLPQVTARLRKQAPIEYLNILAQVHHHPSIIIYSLGCELGDSVDEALLSQLNEILRSHTCGVLACDNSGSGEAYGGLAFDYADFNDYHFYCDLHYFNPLVDHFRRDWRSSRPWIFGEFCDADDYRDLDEIVATNGGQLPWWLTEKNPIHAINILAYAEQAQRISALDIGFDSQTIQRISRQQAFVVRKTILEKVRAHSSMGGYVVTSIRNTPLATSSMFDDLGRMKHDARVFHEVNADSVLVLEQGRARVWKHGGDRPAPVDRLNYVSGSALDFCIVLSQAHGDLPGGELRWTLLDANDQPLQNGRNLVSGTPASSIPIDITRLAFTAPTVETPQEYTLAVELEGTVHNHWPLWIYPAVTEWPHDIALYDSSGSLSGLDDLFDSAENITRQTVFHVPDGQILITSAFTPEVHAFVQSGGRVLVLQTGVGSLPVRPCPFWRESIKLLYDHPILSGFPHRGYADLQFYHLATDYALDTTYLAEIPGVRAVIPLIRRLDARLFTLSDYLVEVQLGAGRLLVSTLRFSGGAGDQVSGLKANIAGRYLLQQILAHLT